MAYINKDLAAYLATLKVGDEIKISSGSSVYSKTIVRMTKTLIVSAGLHLGKPVYERRFSRETGMEYGGSSSSWRRDVILTPESVASREAARVREIKVHKVNALVGALNLPRGSKKEDVLQALADATALVEEML